MYDENIWKNDETVHSPCAHKTKELQPIYDWRGMIMRYNVRHKFSFSKWIYWQLIITMYSIYASPIGRISSDRANVSVIHSFTQ